VARHRSKTAPRAKVLSSELLFQGRVFALKRERVAEPSGLVTTREIVVHPGSAVVLPLLPDGRIILIRQYRHAAGQSLWELVAGHKDPGESFAEGARRELQEETGYVARKITKLLALFPSPGLLGEKMEIFLAQGLLKGAPRPEDDEKITQRIVTLAKAQAWIHSGKIRDAKSIAGILYYASFVAPTR
jgi:ADP-ribose pyrophosphatase